MVPSSSRASQGLYGMKLLTMERINVGYLIFSIISWPGGVQAVYWARYCNDPWWWRPGGGGLCLSDWYPGVALPLLCGYYYCRLKTLYWSEILALCQSWTIHLSAAMTRILHPGPCLLRKIVIQSGNWDTVFSSHHPRQCYWTPLLCHAARDNPALISRHDVTMSQTKHFTRSTYIRKCCRWD